MTRRVDENLAALREYLKSEFPDCRFSEDTALPFLHHKFAMTNTTTNISFKLIVSWSRLADEKVTPMYIAQLLDCDKVAEKMRSTVGKYYKW